VIGKSDRLRALVTFIKLRCGTCDIIDLLSREACSLRFRAPVALARELVMLRSPPRPVSRGPQLVQGPRLVSRGVRLVQGPRLVSRADFRAERSLAPGERVNGN